MKAQRLTVLLALFALALAVAFIGCAQPASSSSDKGDTITIAEIDGVTPPEYGEEPVMAIEETAQFTGTVQWSPAVSDAFAANTVYTATITLTAKAGYTLRGVEADFFTVAEAETVSNAASGRVITAVFPATSSTLPTTINRAAIAGLTIPAAGEAPVTAITETTQYSGTVQWSPAVTAFAADTVYTATIRLTPKKGYTLRSVPANFFTVAGATTVTNAANSGVITAVFRTGLDRTALDAAIIDANEAKSGIVISADGNDVALARFWVTQAVMDTFTAAITAATDIDDDATQAQVNAATTTLTAAITTFNNAKQAGGMLTKISRAVIAGVTIPVRGATAATTITETPQFTGSIAWSPAIVGGKFAGGTLYTATITLTAKEGYTVNGVTADFFTVAGAETVSNPANSRIITAVFTATDQTQEVAYYHVDQHGVLITGSGIVNGEVTIAKSESLLITPTPQAEGFTVKNWTLNGVSIGQHDTGYTFSSIFAGRYTIGLFVEKNGNLYNTNIIVTVTE